MAQETFRLIDALCREGIANDVWGVAEDFNTSVYLGTTEDIDLLGKYLYVYRDVNEHFCFIGKHKPIYSLYHNEDTIVELYKLN